MTKSFKKLMALILCAVMVSCVSAFTVYADETGTEPRRISVCINGDTADSKGICWYTDAETGTEVQVFSERNDISAELTFSDITCFEWEGSFMHKVTVSGLNAGKEYTYRVGNGSVWSEYGTFVTDDGDDKLNFITIADVQASSLENFQKGAATLSAAFSVMPDAEFVANCGDFTNDSTNEEWDYFDEAFASINRSTTLVPVSGNHDGLGVWHWFENMFNLDTSESVQTLNGVNYSFDYGNAHLAVLNTNDVLSMSLSQLNWLKNDMNSTDKDWKIVFMHKSPYTLGKDGKWPDALYLKKSLANVLDACDVDLVMSGHDHMYLRTKALKNNKLSEDGTVYVLAGTAGSKRYEVRRFLANTFLKTDYIGAMTVQKNGYGNYWNGTDWDSTAQTNVGGCFNCISIDGGTLTCKAYILADQKDENGNDIITNIDTFTITKETGKNTATFDGDNTTSPVEFYAGIIPSFISLATYTLTSWLPIFLLIVPYIAYVYITEDTF